MKLHCPNCGKAFDKEVFPLGNKVGCPYCEKTFDLADTGTIALSPEDAPGSGDDPQLSEEKHETAVPEGPVGHPEAEGASPAPETPGPEEEVRASGPHDPTRLILERAGVGPGTRLGGFLLKEEIGRGGMGVVYLGIQESLNRQVAVKVLPPDLSNNPQFVGRFEREAKSLANLSHPNIVSVIDKGYELGHYYFVMEYVQGVSLRSLIDRQDMTPEKALSLVPPLCDALEYAHSQGVIHRDIKPGNILLDSQGRVKIADFGLARIVRGDARGDKLSHTNLVMGTPDYMAPEQRENPKIVDHRADIYSLGVVIYEMLTGSLPIGRFDPPSLSTRGGVQINVRLDDVVMRALEKDRDRRFQRASEVSSAITDIQVGDGPAPAPETGDGAREFSMPPGSRIEVRTLESDVELRGVRGPARVSGDGRLAVTLEGKVLTVEARAGAHCVELGLPEGIPASVSTLSGAVSGSGLSGRLAVRTAEGEIALNDVSGALHVETASGKVTFSRLAVEDLQVRCAESDVLVDGLSMARGSASIHAVEGDVRVNVDGPRSSFRYRLYSEEGDVRSPDGTTVGNAVDGRIGGGEGHLSVETVEGDVVLDVLRRGPGRRHGAMGSSFRRSKGWAGLFSHAGVYAIVCGSLLGLNLLTSPDKLWAGIVALSWGMGLAIHFWTVLIRTLMSPGDDEPGKFVHIRRAYRTGWKRPWTSFVRHLGSYLAVNGFLLFVNLYHGGWPDSMWCIIPAGIWGIGLAVHAWVSLVRWVRDVWGGDEEKEPVTLESVEANRCRIVRKWAGFFGHFGTYVIVNAFLVALDAWGGDPVSWSLFVIAGWGTGVFSGFWSKMTDTMVHISMEKEYRREEDGSGKKAPRFSLLLPSFFNGAVLLAVAFTWFFVPALASHYADVQADLTLPTVGVVRLAQEAHGHPIALWAGVFLLLGLSYGFYFGTGARWWVRGLYFVATLGLLTALGLGAWFTAAPLLM